MAISKLILNGVTQMDVTQDTVTAQTLLYNETATGANGQQITGTYITPTARTETDVTVSDATVTIPAGAYSTQVQKSVASGTTGTPIASKSTVSNNSITVTPSVTNTTGYITGGTKTGTAVTVSASELDSGTKSISANGTGIDVIGYASVDVAVSSNEPNLQTQSKTYTPTTSQQTDFITADSGYDGLDEVNVTIEAMPSGTAGTPTATKGTVSNHSVIVTPSVTNTAGYIAGGTHAGTGISVSASELVSGTKSITANGIGIDVTNYADVDVSVLGSDSVFVVTISYNDQTEMWEPECTIQDIVDAASSGKEIAFELDEDEYSYYYAVGGQYDAGVYGIYYMVFSLYDEHWWSYCSYLSDGEIVPDGDGDLIEPYYQTITKTYTPTESTQTETVTFDTSQHYNGLQEVNVTVNAISSNYVGSGVTRRSDSDLTASGATVTVPAGFYASQVTKSVTSGTAGTPTATKGTVSNNSISITPSVTNTTGYITGETKTGTAVTVSASELVSGTYSITSSGTKDVTNYASVSVAAGSAATPASTVSITPSISVNSSGLITATASGSESVTPTVSAGYVSAGTAGTITISGSNTSQLTTLGATTYNVSSNNQTISSGRYLTGNQTIRGVTTSGITAANIASGITVKVGDSADDDRITSVTGTFTSDANATATDIVSGKSGYVNGTKINGSLVVNNYYTGTNAPSSSLGSNGDLYFQTSE